MPATHVGQRVLLPDSEFYRPSTYQRDTRVYFSDGVIAEHLGNGAVSVKFYGYENTVDYSAIEARRFTRIYPNY